MSKFHEERRKGIGASDVGPILGLSRWSTPFQVWQEKRGEGEPQDESPALEWGLRLEPVIRQKYADETGREVRVPGLMVSDKYPFAIAHLDGVSSDERVVEIKTARTAQEWGEEGTDEVPSVYLVQVQHQMIVSGLTVADIAVLFGGSDFRIYEVHADPELQDIIMQKEAEFWEMVQNGIPPEPVSYADAVQRFKLAEKGKRVTADNDALGAVALLNMWKDEKKAAEAAVEEWSAKIMTFMGDADTLVDAQGKVLVTWKQDAKGRTTIDADALRADGLYEKYAKAGAPGRRFLVKA